MPGSELHDLIVFRSVARPLGSTLRRMAFPERAETHPARVNALRGSAHIVGNLKTRSSLFQVVEHVRQLRAKIR